jgi:hypothetical protein
MSDAERDDHDGESSGEWEEQEGDDDDEPIGFMSLLFNRAGGAARANSSRWPRLLGHPPPLDHDEHLAVELVAATSAHNKRRNCDAVRKKAALCCGIPQPGANTVAAAVAATSQPSLDAGPDAANRRVRRLVQSPQV